MLHAEPLVGIGNEYFSIGSLNNRGITKSAVGPFSLQREHGLPGDTVVRDGHIEQVSTRIDPVEIVFRGVVVDQQLASVFQRDRVGARPGSA